MSREARRAEAAAIAARFGESTVSLRVDEEV